MDNQFDCWDDADEQPGLILLRSLKNNLDDETIENLINNNCNINDLDNEGNTPLHYAVQRRNAHIAHLLIQKGANVNARNKNGFTPLHMAAKYGRISILREILNHQQVNKDERNERGETPLYLSLLANHPDEVVSALIDAGCNINLSNGWHKKTPLHLAVLRQSDTIACKLVEAGADMNAKDYRDGLTPLHEAVRRCSDEQFVAYLIERANDVNVVDHKNYTPLHYAAYRDSTFIAQKLIDKGANVDFINFKEGTLLHHAVDVGNLEYLCMLLYYNASASERNHKGRTPFFESVCCYGFKDDINGREIIRTLINYVTDINQVDEGDISVLDVALMYNYNIALDILEHDANVNKLFSGMHPLYLALRHKSYDVLKLIWQKTDFEMLLNSEVKELDNGKSFLRIYCEHSVLQSEEFVEFLLTMFDCPYIEQLVQPTCPKIDEHLIRSIASERNLTSRQMLDVISVFLSYGVSLYFKDVCFLYEKYGFNECLQFILMSCCYIHPELIHVQHMRNPLIYLICYDGNNQTWYKSLRFSIFFAKDLFSNSRNGVQDKIVDKYCSYYRLTARRHHQEVIFRPGISATGEIRSLLEICRDLIRTRIYRKCNTPYSSGAYYAISRLPVPNPIRDVLLLKRSIYTNQ